MAFDGLFELHERSSVLVNHDFDLPFVPGRNKFLAFVTKVKLKVMN